MQRYENSVMNQFAQVLPGVNVTVYLAGTTTLANLFADDGVTPLSNPVSSDANGRFFFSVVDGLYDLQFSGVGVTTYKRKNEQIYNLSGLGAGAAPLLQTNTVNNGSQSKLDLVGSGGIKLTDDGVGNITLAAAFSFGFYAPGLYNNSALIVAYGFTRTVTFPANWGVGGSNPPFGRCDTNPTATETVTVKKKTAGGTVTTVGTITVSTSGVYTFATTGGSTVSFANGDEIEFYNQASADISFAGMRVTAQGS